MTKTQKNEALFRACESGDVEAARFHLEKGVDVRAKGRWGETPLHVACTEDRPDLVLFLIEHGADVNAKDMNGRTPLNLTLMLPERGAVIAVRERILGLFREHAPDAVMEAYCTAQERR
ncbi:MAG: ankyrin repeat domain-containing protein [Syntrophorhabdus sp.]|nr:ankyrin repeat domain-containing protein [Syntrophorhabdus sp.]